MNRLPSITKGDDIELIEGEEEKWVYNFFQNIRYNGQKIHNYILNSLTHMNCPKYNSFIKKVGQDHRELLKKQTKELIEILVDMKPSIESNDYNWGIRWINTHLSNKEGQKILLEILKELSCSNGRFSDKDSPTYLEDNIRLRQLYQVILFHDSGS